MRGGKGREKGSRERVNRKKSGRKVERNEEKRLKIGRNGSIKGKLNEQKRLS